MKEFLARLFPGRGESPSIAKRWIEILLHHVDGYARLDAAELARLHECVQYLVAQKNWEGCGGLQLTEEMKVAISGNAALMGLGFPGYRFPNVDSVLVYPDAFLVEDPRGGRRLLQGEASVHGAVAVAWSGPEDPRRTAVVVIHEFAHLFDALDGEVDGIPPIPDREARAVWPAALRREFARFVAEEQEGNESILTPYAATHPSEFFAMGSECFFCRPVELLKERPAVYELLRQWYRQDTVERIDTEGPAQVPPESEPDLDARVRELEALVRGTPDFAEGWEELGGLHSERGHWEEGATAYTMQLELQPGNAAAHFARGVCRAWLNETEGARSDFEQAIALEPDVADGYVERARLLLSAGELEAAIADAERAVGLDPERVEARMLRAWCWSYLGEPGRALEDCEFVNELAPGDPSAAWCEGELRADAGEYAAALERAEFALRAFGERGEDPPAACHLLRGFSLLHLGEHARALEDVERALAVDPESAEALKLRGEIRFELGDPKRALADCTEAIRRWPDYANAHRLRARVYDELGQPERAAEDEARATELES